MGRRSKGSKTLFRVIDPSRTIREPEDLPGQRAETSAGSGGKHRRGASVVTREGPFKKGLLPFRGEGTGMKEIRVQSPGLTSPGDFHFSG
jgi:hypothetical protein